MTGLGITLGCAPTLANLVGTIGTDSLLKTINNGLNSAFFGSAEDIYDTGRRLFIQNAVEPIRRLGNSIQNLIGMYDNPDVFRPLETEADFKSVPQCMHDSILRYGPVKALFDDARIFGFGRDYVDSDDIYKRLINNGRVDDVKAASDKNGVFYLKYEYESTDPDLSSEELDSIERTRLYIDKMLSDTNFDPTDYPNDRA